MKKEGSQFTSPRDGGGTYGRGTLKNTATSVTIINNTIDRILANNRETTWSYVIDKHVDYMYMLYMYMLYRNRERCMWNTCGNNHSIISMSVTVYTYIITLFLIADDFYSFTYLHVLVLWLTEINLLDFSIMVGLQLYVHLYIEFIKINKQQNIVQIYRSIFGCRCSVKYIHLHPSSCDK